MADVTITRLIDRLGLEPLKEGGMGVKVYTHHSGSSLLGTTSYVLVTDSCRQVLHRLSSEQTWCYLEGSDARQLVLLPDGGWRHYDLGLASEGKKAISIVPAGCWQAVESDGWALFSVLSVPPAKLEETQLWDKTLAPGWDCKELAGFGG